jgi:thymidylate kinase
MKSRQGREKFERLEFLQSVDENFRRMANLEPDRFVLINAGGNAEDVAEEATRAALKHLSR